MNPICEVSEYKQKNATQYGKGDYDQGLVFIDEAKLCLFCHRASILPGIELISSSCVLKFLVD